MANSLINSEIYKSAIYYSLFARGEDKMEPRTFDAFVDPLLAEFEEFNKKLL